MCCNRKSGFAVILFAAAVGPAMYSGTKGSDDTKDAIGLRPGDRVENVELRTIDDEPVMLHEVFEEFEGPTVVTFYRGGWCPYCNNALKEWEEHLGAIEDLDAEFVAITPESPDNATDTGDKNDVSFEIYSDHTQAAARAFGVHFSLAEDTVSLYRKYDIDLARSNADGKWDLPHPATFIVDDNGVVLWAHVDPDYKNGRADPEDVIKKLEEIALAAEDE